MSAELDYVDLWLRVGASLIDTVLILRVTYPILPATYGVALLDASRFAGPADVVISWLFRAAATVAFWLTRQATPAKMAISAKVVNARSGARISAGQAVVRYLGYVVWFLPLRLGIRWVAFDRRKEGCHDMVAATVVVRPLRSGATPARFDTDRRSSGIGRSVEP